MTRSRWLGLYQLVAGLSDFATGLMLLIAPAFTLHQMGVWQMPEPAFYIRYVGVFVLSVGATYLCIPALLGRSPEAHIWWRAQWAITALIRCLVALFVLWQVVAGAMGAAWLSVFFTDALYAAIQSIGLRNGWLRQWS
jgi:hypothetical protein